MDKNDVLQMLITMLKLVAAEHEEQISSFPDFVHITDEIALNYNEAILMFNQFDFSDILSKAIIHKITQIDTVFDHMSADKTLWNNIALAKHSTWGMQRTRATNILNKMNWEQKAPGIRYSIKYYPAKKE